MPLKKLQFSIGKIFYITAFIATLVASQLAPFPYGFIYIVGFVFAVSSYIGWLFYRLDSEMKQTPVEPWDNDLPPVEDADETEQAL
ncbi:MAG: hypothetical protein AB8B55_05930 [Mariniblastus sp.]